ncbi:MAG TPA: helix-turn-helix transcriptional regulator [Streptosporangiaceae bacterium]
MKAVDPGRDDAGVRLRTLRLRRGLSQVALAGLACVSPAFISMIENGQRPLRSADHILALADVLDVSPLYLADGRADFRAAAEPAPRPVPFPARCDPVTLARHQRLAREYTALLAAGDGRAAGDWLRRLAREPTVNPWLLIDQLATVLAR